MRRLAQTEAADKIKQNIQLAMDSGIHGVAIPINYFLWNINQVVHSTQQMTVGARVAGAEVWSQLLIDTGSSAVLFCNNSLAELPEQEELKTDYLKCIGYGYSEQCPNSNLTYAPSGVLSSHVYRGDLFLEGSLSDEAAQMFDVYYGIVSKDNGCAAAAILDGIFGATYSTANKYFLPTNGSITLSDIDIEVCEVDGIPQRTCDKHDLTETELINPLEATLQLDVESGLDHAEAFGLYVDYGATKGSVENEYVPGLGAYFGGDMAFNNPYYNRGTVQVSRVMLNPVHGPS